MRLLILLALAAVACAEHGWMQPECSNPEDSLFRTGGEAICLHLHKEPMLFDEAAKYCTEKRARLVTLEPRTRKVNFLNDLIIKSIGDEEDADTWFADARLVQHKTMPLAHMVLIANEDPRKMEIVHNKTAVSRPFVCEMPAQPTSSRPQFYLQPEDVQISEEVLNSTENLKSKDEEKRPFAVSFFCRAFATPKPTIQWMFINEDDSTNELVTEKIDAKEIHILQEVMKDIDEQQNKTHFFDKRRDCSRHHCNPEAVMETSELIIVNPQLLDLKRHVICVAKNEAGSVMSRDAEIIVNRMAEFPEDQREEEVKVIAGQSITIPCELETHPDASAEWLRVVSDDRTQKIEELNMLSRGNIQASKATFDLFIDAAVAQDAGRYICRVQMHNGRYHFVHRDRVVNLIVEECKENCELDKKPIEVLPGYPTFMSLNPMSNEHIRTGDAVLLECPCSGKRYPQEILSVMWNMTTPNMRRLGVQPVNSAVLIEQANTNNSGIYGCRCVRQKEMQPARAGGRPELEMSEWKSVSINVLPLLAPTELPLSIAKVNEVANLTCQLPKVNIPGVKIFVTPMRDTTSLFDILTAKNDPRISLTDKDEKYTISIKDVKAEDAGIYGFRLSISYFDQWTENDTYYTTLRVVQ